MSPGQDPFSQLLYPMLQPQPPVDDTVIAELAAAPLQKSDETNRLRRELLAESANDLAAAAARTAECLRRGGRLLACGNGGSATSAADIVAELMCPRDGVRSLPALCLTNDVAVVTAISNDVSFDDVFVRQVIAFGRRGDVLLVVSTSGNSENLVRGLRQARSQGLLTLAITGYDGGRIAREVAVDHCFVVRSASVHRIQEAQATLYHALVELVQREITEDAACA